MHNTSQDIEPTPTTTGDAPIISKMSKRDHVYREIINALNALIKPAEKCLAELYNNRAPFGNAVIIDPNGLDTKADVVLAFLAALLGTNGGAIIYDPRGEFDVSTADPKRSTWDKLGDALGKCLTNSLTKEQRDAWVAMCTLYAMHRDEIGGAE